MNGLRRWLYLSLIICFCSTSFASHIVGGFIRYDCQGPVDQTFAAYEVTVVLYRDVLRANAQAIFTQTIPLTVFSQGTQSVINLNLLSTKIIADSTEDPCFVRIDSLELEEGVYRGIVQLDRSDEHLLVYQRCCRNNSIDNLVRPTNAWGNTWTIEVPIYNNIGCNSSPDFVDEPPLSYCPNQPLSFDLSATDSDGDSLAYSFCTPFTSPQFEPQPNPAFAPPYGFIQFLAPQSEQAPVPSNPALNIDVNTGLLTGTPNGIGQYVVGFCIEEYRNGVLLTTTRRDIQINSANCNPIILTAVQDQELLCDGRTVRFNNETQPVSGYEIKGFKWDFGDPTTLADTSRERVPLPYTYPDTGLYTITLTANPGLRCSSVTTKDFLVYDSLNPKISFEGLFCEDSNSVNFYADGEVQDYAIFEWSFGNSATAFFALGDTVLNIQFSPTSNEVEVELKVSQDICERTVKDTVRFSPNPRAAFLSNRQEICPPFPVEFINNSFVDGNAEFIWTFGDGDSAFIADPTHEYLNAGDYEVKLELRSTENCIDTAIFTDSIFASRDFSPNLIDFDYSPKIGCAPLNVTFSDSSSYNGSGTYLWDLDNNNLGNQRELSFNYQDTGYYDIGLLLITSDTCADTLNLFIDSAIRVNPTPEAVFTASLDSVFIEDAEVFLDGSASQGFDRSEIQLNGNIISNQLQSFYEFQDTGKQVVDLILSNSVACSDTASVEVFVFDLFELSIPNVFTPNGDGINDDFRVVASGIYQYAIKVFNRFGKQVYFSNSIEAGWDGYINERKAAPGVYFYEIVVQDPDGNFRDFQGTISLLYE